ncbi:hypothetical protein LXL04_011638 [Taraxacum kok-saghyz]
MAVSSFSKFSKGFGPNTQQDQFRSFVYIRNNLSYKDAVQGGSREIPKTVNTPKTNNTVVTNNSYEVLNISGDIDRTEELKVKLVGELIHFKAITHIVNVLIGEGIHENSIDYLGDLWILISPKNEEERNKFLTHEGIRSWFKIIKDWESDFNAEQRISWISIEGLPAKFWSLEVLVQIARKFKEDDTRKISIFSYSVKNYYEDSEASSNNLNENDHSDVNGVRGAMSDGESSVREYRSWMEDEESTFIADTCLEENDIKVDFFDQEDNNEEREKTKSTDEFHNGHFHSPEDKCTDNNSKKSASPAVSNTASSDHNASNPAMVITPNQNPESPKNMANQNNNGENHTNTNLYSKISTKLQDILKTPYNQRHKSLIGEEGEIGKLNGDDLSTRKKLHFSPRITRSKAKSMQTTQSEQPTQFESGYMWKPKTKKATYEAAEVNQAFSMGTKCGIIKEG